MTIFEKRLTFLNDTVSFYGSNTKRRVKGQYISSDGRSCAIGRHIKPEMRSIHYTGSVGNIKLRDPETCEYTPVDTKDLLPENIYELGELFLRSVSSLHDVNHYWNDEFGLNSAGQEEYLVIVKTYCTTDFHIDYQNEYIIR